MHVIFAVLVGNRALCYLNIMGDKVMRGHKIISGIITFACLITLSGCVSQSDYDALLAERNALITERDELSDNSAYREQCSA